MAWNRTCRRAARACRHPSLEDLEDRLLLATSSVPASSSLPPTPSDALIGAAAVRASYGIDGAGLAAAVIDTGIDYHHKAFGNGFGPGFPVQAGYDFGDDDHDPDASSWQHGTAVAGLLASHDPAHPGVAPGAGLVALRVFGDDNRGDFSRIADALQWVVDHHDQEGITVVNLSLSDGNNYAPPFLPYFTVGNRITALVRQLKDLDIPVVTATGNSFKGVQGVGFTAIIAETISVTGSDLTDHLVANAQRLGTPLGGDYATDLVAPAAGVIAPDEGNRFISVNGTSFAAPQVSGAVLLLQQIYQTRFGHLPKVADLVGWLKGGADPIFDPVTTITIGRLNIAQAAALIPAAPTPRVEAPAAPTPAPVPTIPAATPAPTAATPETPTAATPETPTAATPETPTVPRSETAATPAPPAAQQVTSPLPPTSETALTPATPPASPSDRPSVLQPDAPPASGPDPALVSPPDAPPADPPAATPSVLAPPAEDAALAEPEPSPPSPPIAPPALETPASSELATDIVGDGSASESDSPARPESPTDQVFELFAAAVEALALDRGMILAGSSLSNAPEAQGLFVAEGRPGLRRGRVRFWGAARVRTSLGTTRLRPRH